MLRVLRNPRELMLDQWNWKAALFSSLFRAILFFCANLGSGWRAASGAMAAEFLYRGATSGFYGAFTQCLRAVQPAWAGALVILLLLPLGTHSMEFVVHWLRGTPHLKASIITSVCFTGLSSLFNWFAMRQGLMIVGHGSQSLSRDMRMMPRVVADFLMTVPRAIRFLAARRNLRPTG